MSRAAKTQFEIASVPQKIALLGRKSHAENVCVNVPLVVPLPKNHSQKRLVHTTAAHWVSWHVFITEHKIFT